MMIIYNESIYLPGKRSKQYNGKLVKVFVIILYTGPVIYRRTCVRACVSVGERVQAGLRTWFPRFLWIFLTEDSCKRDMESVGLTSSTLSPDISGLETGVYVDG